MQQTFGCNQISWHTQLGSSCTFGPTGYWKFGSFWWSMSKQIIDKSPLGLQNNSMLHPHNCQVVLLWSGYESNDFNLIFCHCATKFAPIKATLTACAQNVVFTLTTFSILGFLRQTCVIWQNFPLTLQKPLVRLLGGISGASISLRAKSSRPDKILSLKRFIPGSILWHNHAHMGYWI